MKKIVSYMLALTFFLNSCSHYQERPVAHNPSRVPLSSQAQSCHEAAGTILSPALRAWSEHLETHQLAVEYTKHFDGLRVKNEEIELMGRYLHPFPSELAEIEKLRRALLFTRTIKDEEKRSEFWLAFSALDDQQKVTNKHVKTFLKEEKFLKKYEARLSKKIEAKKYPNKETVLHSKMRIFERGYYQCLQGATDPSQLTKKVIAQSNKVAIAVTVGGMGSAMVTYAATNYDLPKDKKWWFEIFYVIVTSMAMSYVNAKFILANPKLKPWSQRLPLVLGASAVEDIGVTALYSQLVGDPHKDIQEKLEKLEEDPEFKKALKEALEYISKDHLYHKYESAAKNFLTKVSPDGKETKLTEVELEQVDWSTVDPDLTRELFVEALTDYEYEQQKGPMSIGNEEYDRYAFHRLIDLIYQPSFLIAAIIMHKQLCRAINPKLGMLQAISTFMAINMASDAVYFFSRRALINQ